MWAVPGDLRSWTAVSQPSSRGIITSSVMTAGSTSVTLSRQSCPSTAVDTSNPSSWRLTAISRRITSSSSTTSTRPNACATRVRVASSGRWSRRGPGRVRAGTLAGTLSDARSPHSSGERATASGAVSAGSNPAGGASRLQDRMYCDLLERKLHRCHSRTRDASGGRQMTASAAHTRPNSSVLPQVQRLVHASDPDALKPGHAPRVDAGEDLDRVARPGGDLGGRDTGVEPPGDPGMPEIVGPLHQRRGQLLGRERGGPDLLPHLPPRGRLERVPALGAEQSPVRGYAERLDVRAEELDKL